MNDTERLLELYPHLKFIQHWESTNDISYLLGKAESLVNAISRTPILPEYHKKLLNVALIKGAMATTAIEGNTLTQEEVEKVQAGEHLPPSREYLETEVKNVINALNTLLKEVVYIDKIGFISPQLIKRFHYLIGKDLGDKFDAVPGQFASRGRFVAAYKCPDHRDVPILIDNLCEWVLKEFHFDKGRQSFSENVIQAIVTHIYIEWIHPFDDGNGRTGRLLEYYVLLRGGLPDIASHILSNHYNLTRNEYYRNISNATKTQSLTAFIKYALIGFVDGLNQTLEVIQENQKTIMWHKYIYDKIEELRSTNTIVFKRKRNLILEMPVDKSWNIKDLKLATPKIAALYTSVHDRTMMRDLEELVEIELVKKDKNHYKANTDILKGYLSQKKNI